MKERKGPVARLCFCCNAQCECLGPCPYALMPSSLFLALLRSK